MCQSSHEITKAEHFKIFRDYMQHEDNLINQRVSWNSTIQGFLFATYGLSQQKLPDPKPGPGALHNLETLVRTHSMVWVWPEYTRFSCGSGSHTRS